MILLPPCRYITDLIYWCNMVCGHFTTLCSKLPEKCQSLLGLHLHLPVFLQVCCYQINSNNVFLPFNSKVNWLCSYVRTSVSKGRDVPGQTGTGHPVVPLSRDNSISLVPLSLCPGTRAGANVPGQSPLSRDVPRDKIGRKNTKKRSKMVKKCIFLLIFLLSRICPGSWYIIDSPHCTWYIIAWYIINFWIPFASFLVSRSVILHLVIVPGRPGTGRDSMSKIPSRPVARFWACPVVPLSRDNEETSVPLSRKVPLSRPVGNPITDPSDGGF